MSIGKDKIIPKESLCFAAKGPGMGRMARQKLLDNNSHTPTKHHRENQSLTPVIQQRLKNLDIHLHLTNMYPFPSLVGVSEGKVESRRFHAHTAAVRPVPLPCHRISGDHMENSNEVVITLPGVVVSTEDQREPEFSALLSGNKVPLSSQSVNKC